MYQDNVLFSERKWGDPVRVKASFSSHSKRVDGHVVPEYRRFSVDPQLTTYEILRSLVSRAFDIQSDFLIQYRFEEQSGQEIFLHLISDWDLEAAFDRAADPYLCLRIDPIPLEQTVEEWDLVSIPSGEYKTPQSKEIRNDPSIQTKILTKMEKTITMMQQALNLNGGSNLEFAIGSSTAPLTDSEFTDYRDGVGTLVNIDKFRQRVFQGGLEPSLRRVVWKHLLNVYPDGLTGSERMKYIGKKSDEYRRLKNDWMVHYLNKKMTDEVLNISSMVRKDVLRTDRHYSFYSGGDDNPNVEQLFNILTTYAVYHPSVGYCQGMSDMASPILFVMGNESHAYIAFTALMERLKDNFTTSGATMTLKFEHLACALAFYDPVFYNYLQRHYAVDLLFCYRWLLLEMKREFAFDDALRMLEVMWSVLPLKPRQEELALYETIPEFNPVTPPIPLPRLKESPYTKVCALRRQGSSMGSSSSLYDPSAQLDATPQTKNSRMRGNSSSSWERHSDSIYRRSRTNGCSTNDTDSEADADDSTDEPSTVQPEFTDPEAEDGDVFGDQTHSAVTDETTCKSYANESDDCQDFEVIASCEEAVELASKDAPSRAPTAATRLPPPDVFGCGNPFLIFLCITVLLQQRDAVISRGMDNNELAMHFDRMVRKHNVERVLSQARTLYYKYLGHSKNQSPPISPKRNV